ncbi:hypothetical protein MXB_1018, partial [Myxobolus squamalis]
VDSEWLEYKLKYELNFLESEENSRKENFFKNQAFILMSNLKTQTYTLKMNQFGHLNKNERTKLLMLNRSKRLHRDKTMLSVRIAVSNEYDWRRVGVVSPVKNQLKCNACYAFSAIGAIESQFAIHTRILPDLSEQEMVDCSWTYGNSGCFSGFPQNVYIYGLENGISTSVSYPYNGRVNMYKFIFFEFSMQSK